MQSIHKDVMWRRYKDLKEFIRDRQCTRNEMHRATEANIQKCTKEMKQTTRATKELKRIGRVLGEPTNTDRFRR